MFRRMFAVLALTLSSASVAAPGAAAESGRFVDRLIAETAHDGDVMMLVEPLTYIDTEGLPWTAPAGEVVTGRSVPRWMWSAVGSPMRGAAREAAAIHDYFATTRARPWRDTHRVFFEALLTNGVPREDAMRLYAALYRFGPRWDASLPLCDPSTACTTEARVTVRSIDPRPDPAALDALLARIEPDSTLDEIEVVADAGLDQQLYLVAEACGGMGSVASFFVGAFVQVGVEYECGGAVADLTAPQQ